MKHAKHEVLHVSTYHLLINQKNPYLGPKTQSTKIIILLFMVTSATAFLYYFRCFHTVLGIVLLKVSPGVHLESNYQIQESWQIFLNPKNELTHHLVLLCRTNCEVYIKL